MTWKSELNKGLCIHPEILSLVGGVPKEGRSEPLVEAAWQGMGMGEEFSRESLFWPWHNKNPNQTDQPVNLLFSWDLGAHST